MEERILLKNARILSLRTAEITKGNVVIGGDKIVYVGLKIDQYAPFSKIIDVKNNLLMPSFKNGHAHSAMIFARSIADTQKLEEWLYHVIFPMEKHFRKGDIYHLTKVALLEYIRNGITYAHEMYFEPLEMKQAFDEFGLRADILLCVSNDFDERYAAIKNAMPTLETTFGIHAIYTTSQEELDEAIAYVNKHQRPFYLHALETRTEADNFYKLHQETILQYLCKKGAFNYGGAIFHGIYLTDDDIALCKKYNISIISNPSSNLKLASGICPIAKYLSAGLNVGLGTDGASSNNSLNMFKELFLSASLSKVLFNDASLIEPFSALKMANVNVLKAVNRNDSLYLEAGQRADIIMIDMKHPSMQPENDIVANLVYAGSSSLIKMTMSGGRILYYDGHYYLGESVTKIYKKATAISNRLKKYIAK